MHDFLPKERAARAVVQQIVTRCGVGQPRDEVVYSERKLCLRRERKVGLQTDIARARSVGSDAFSAGLRVCAKLRADRTFELEGAEQRFHTAFELRLVCDGICEVRAPNFLSFLRAKRSHEKVPPVVYRTRANA